MVDSNRQRLIQSLVWKLSGIVELSSNHLCQQLIGNQLTIKALTKDLDFRKIFLANRDHVEAVCFGIDQTSALFHDLIGPTGIDLTEKYAFLDTIKAEVFTSVRHFLSGAIGGDVINEPSQHYGAFVIDCKRQEKNVNSHCQASPNKFSVVTTEGMSVRPRS